MEKPTKQNTMYLPIKQEFFDQIIAGTKKEEYRDILPTTYKKYLDCDEFGEPFYDDTFTDEEAAFYGADMIMAYHDGKFPFFFKEDIKYLNLAVGYSKVRDTATVEVTEITAQLGKDKKGNDARFDFDDKNKVVFFPDGRFCVWQAVFHLGKIIEQNIVSKK